VVSRRLPLQALLISGSKLCALPGTLSISKIALPMMYSSQKNMDFIKHKINITLKILNTKAWMAQKFESIFFLKNINFVYFSTSAEPLRCEN
jgi:hypothetical protein